MDTKKDDSTISSRAIQNGRLHKIDPQPFQVDDTIPFHWLRGIEYHIFDIIFLHKFNPKHHPNFVQNGHSFAQNGHS